MSVCVTVTGFGRRGVTGLPKVTGLFETHLTVSDLDRSIAFWRDVIGLPLADELPELRDRVWLDLALDAEAS